MICSSSAPTKNPEEPIVIMSRRSSTEILLSQARSVIEIEAGAVSDLLNNLDDSFGRACRMVLDCRGRVVVIGMGKSGHIGGKIASTLASTGTPAFFLHPGEASHGDVGMITTDDLTLIISNSGETMEVVSIIPIVKRLGVKMIAMTGKPGSTLALQSDAHLNVHVNREACPHNLAPTASTTATLVMGDALAVTVQKERGFSVQDFARTHPGGMLGKRLLLYARDLMHTGNELPLVRPDESMGMLLLEMSSKSLGMAGIVDNHNRLLGMFTDGDLRRALENEVDIYARSAKEVMNLNPFTITADTLAEQIVKTMRDFAQHGPHAMNGVFVVDHERVVVGALNTHDLLRAGVI